MNSCISCGSTDNLHLVETNNGLYTMIKCMCLECYERSVGKHFFDAYKGDPAFYTDESESETVEL